MQGVIHEGFSFIKVFQSAVQYHSWIEYQVTVEFLQKEPDLQCPSCEIYDHKVCWAKWVEISNIVIPYVFRCYNCFNILKLDEQYVNNIQKRKIHTEPKLEKLKKDDLVKYLEKLKTNVGPKLIHVEDPMAIGDFADEYDAKFSEEEMFGEKNLLKK